MSGAHVRTCLVRQIIILKTINNLTVSEGDTNMYSKTCSPHFRIELEFGVLDHVLSGRALCTTIDVINLNVT